MAEIFEYVPSESEPWYKPGKSIQEFHESTALVRVLVGGRGSGKTSAICVEAVCKHCFNNPGAKVYLLRKTELSQEATSIETFNQVFGELGPLYQECENSLFQKWNDAKTIRVPSKVAIEKYEAFKATKPSKSEIEMWLKTEGNRWCSFLEFKGIPDAAKRDNKLRGFEASLLIMIEADLLELADFQMMGPCLRWKGADGKFIEDRGIILDTNPPGTKHWIAKLEEDEKARVEKGHKSLYQFWHISTYENEHNLPKGYIEQSVIMPYQSNPPMLERMLWGKYADAFDGQAVFDQFSFALHSKENLPFPKGAYLVRGWDFGQSNAVVWSAYWRRTGMADPELNCEFWWDLHEQVLFDSDVEKQCKGVLEITSKEFPFWNDRTICAGILDWGDPAGAAKKDTGSSISVLNTFGIYPGYKHKDRGIPKTVALVNRLLGMRTKLGEVVYQIDKIGCPTLHAGLSGGFRYPVANETNYGSGLPKKDGVYDHVCLHPKTRVLVKRGWIPISEVIPEKDYAMTRKGWRKVTHSWETSKSSQMYEAKFSNGSSLISTGDHPIWCENKSSFIPLLDVTQSDRVSECVNVHFKHLMVNPTTDIQHISGLQPSPILTCIGMFGGYIMEIFQKAITFIISMAIQQIIPLKTCCVLPHKSTANYQDELIEKNSFYNLKKCGLLQKHGTPQKRENCGILNMESKYFKIESLYPVLAIIADHTMKPNHQKGQGFAQINANQPGGENKGLMKLMLNALHVLIYIKGVNMLGLQKPVHLVTLTGQGVGAVWNMTVEQEHEYYAEGILVSNCDAARYAKINCLRLDFMDVEAKKDNTGILAANPYKNPAKRYK